MADKADDILDGLFHWCAWAAYLDQATRLRAYDYYEATVAAKRKRATSPPPWTPTSQSRRVDRHQFSTWVIVMRVMTAAIRSPSILPGGNSRTHPIR